MGDEPVGDRDDDSWTSVTAKIKESELETLQRRFPDVPSDSERFRRAVWFVTAVSNAGFAFDHPPDETHEDDDWTSVTTKIHVPRLEMLRRRFPDPPSDSERFRRAVWFVDTVETAAFEFNDRDAGENESK
ncbi:hypothetical protein A6E15_19465 [Natrinema saccharevitans]|uniref:Uncharacterized protein n=1 Tax=Natrinema saccharevitans TaxID=301967 RepID=A0A1S8ARI0_9EURY|nr:hypothetical protein [Natrinema saccharevitans]OLZ39058.1 hypothetical protein A6E15_19020 [Natrinema saccharevitans]OLZ39144.1 hypothetical protein A6E15_19465 [Natrinema saccharevitans]